MSLSIDSRCITAIYALGQWFEVEEDSVDVDAYEFINQEDETEYIKKSKYETHKTLYAMGSLYDESEPPPLGGRFEGTDRFYYANPQGCHGITFIEKGTNNRVSFSLLEVKAFKENNVSRSQLSV